MTLIRIEQPRRLISFLIENFSFAGP